MNTNWSTPKRNVFAAILDLRKALAAGQNAVLIKTRNEDCQYPIKVKNSITDFRAYKFSMGLLKSRTSIANNERMPAFEKYLSLNYKTCYGTPEAVDRYYSKALLSSDNFKGVGVSHLVAVKDLIRFYACLPDKRSKDYAKMYTDQYYGERTADDKHFYDHYRLKTEHSAYTIQRFKRRVWVVELLNYNQKVRTPFVIKILNVICYPLKFIPKKSVLRMADYKIVTFKIGAVINGYQLRIYIPKKFSFK